MINQLQTNILDPDFPLSAILREAKVLASQLESDDLGEWVSRELNGYEIVSTLPDYRILITVTQGSWTNNFYMLPNRGVPMYKITDENLTEFLTHYHAWDGIRTIEELSMMPDDKKLQLPADIVGLVNTYVAEGGYGYSQLHFALGATNFIQILDSVRNRLLDFILELSKSWDSQSPLPPRSQISQLVGQTIYMIEGGNMTLFDQRGQQVEYQYNAAGNIHISQAETTAQFAEELAKLRGELDLAKNAGAIPANTAAEASKDLSRALKEVQAPEPRKGNILDHIGKAKALLQDFGEAVQLVAALTQAAVVISDLLK